MDERGGSGLLARLPKLSARGCPDWLAAAFMLLPYQSKGDCRMRPDDIPADVDPRYQDSSPVFGGGLLHDAYCLCQGIVHLSRLLDMYFQHAGCFQLRILELHDLFLYMV